MRLFIAIDCNNNRDHFLSLQNKLQDRFEPEHITLTNSFHLSLKFLGDVSFDRAEYIKRKLAKIQHAAFSTTTDHMGFFSAHPEKGVVWAGLSNWQQTISLQQTINRQLRTSFRPQSKFIPHITLARVHQEQLTGKHLQAYSEGTPAINIHANSFSLIQSIPERGRFIHKTLYSVPLTGK